MLSLRQKAYHAVKFAHTGESQQMNNVRRATVIGGALLLGTAVSHAQEIAGGELTANIGAVSNYLFRGVTQTDDDAAIQGGIDWAHSSGFYLGTWASNVDFGDGTSAEVDLFGGYDFAVGDFDLGVNTIYYWYPDGSNIDYWEIGGSGGWRWLSAGIQYTVYGEANDGAFQEHDVYYYGGLDFEPLENWGLGFKLGYYDFDDSDADSYTHWGVSVSRSAGDFGTFSFNYEATNSSSGDSPSDTNDPKFWVGWTKTF
jgi:uncharacterized protein (TIGR02001 family)